MFKFNFNVEDAEQLEFLPDGDISSAQESQAGQAQSGMPSERVVSVNELAIDELVSIKPGAYPLFLVRAS